MKKRISLETYEALTAFSFILPAVIIIGAFRIIPLFYAFGLSLFEWDMITKATFVGLKNYINLLTEPEFYQALGVTFYYVIVAVPVGLSLSLCIALLLNQGIKFLGFFRTAFFIPYITSITAVSVVWLWLYNPEYGLLNFILKDVLGLQPQKWLEDSRLAMPCIIATMIWKNLGWNSLIYLTRLQSIDKTYYEAAEIDGSNAWNKFRYITWPLLMPTTVFLLVVTTIFAFEMFQPIFVMTPDGGPENSTTTIVFYLYKKAYEEFQMGFASSIAYVLFFITLVITFIQRKFLKTAYEY